MPDTDDDEVSLVRINSTLDVLTDNIKKLTDSMGGMDKELFSLKQKQEFLEASWQDPNFEFDYDPNKEDFITQEEGKI